MHYVIGVDIGTSSTKAVVFDAAGQQAGRSAKGYALQSPEPGAAEQNADDILQATVQTVRDVVTACDIDASQLLGISFSAAMHTLLLLDERSHPITPLYTWADNRSDKITQQLKEKTTETSIYQRTGLPIHPMSPMVKLAWLRQTRPEIFEQATRVVAIKEYVLHRWCGEWVVDLSMASTTGLLNLRSRQWDPAALNIAGITTDQLSQLVPTTHQLSLSETYAQKMGLRPGTPIIVGASDGVLSNLGVGAINPGQAAITLGTSGAVRQVVPQPITADEAQLFCYALTADRWVMGGAVNNGGIALQWTRDSLVPYSVAPDEQRQSNAEPSASTYERLTKMASAIAPGADGLIFHPHILGERAPLWNAQACGNLFGLSRHHTQAHLVRAVMEGVLYNMQSVFSALESAGGSVKTLSASGGFAHSDLWQQMLADIFEREVQIPTVIESSAFGAAVLALVVLGEWPDLTHVTECITIAHTRQPIAKNVKRYQKLLPVYTDLLAGFQHQYQTLKSAIEPIP
ncbi:MAG: gluconokinase [Cyanobacteria bacterium J06649_4]